MNVAEVLTAAGRFGGIAGIALIAVAFVLHQIIARKIFPKLDQERSYQLLKLIAVIIGILGFTSICAWGYCNSAYNQMQGAVLRVNVVDEAGEPERDANVWATWGTAHKDKDLRWEIAIPPDKNLNHTKITVYAENKEEFLTGHTELDLSGEASQDVGITLHKNENEKIVGAIEDADGKRLSGVRVFVSGHPNEAVISDDTGEFSLPARGSKGETVRLCVTSAGVSTDHDVQIVSHPITISVGKTK